MNTTMLFTAMLVGLVAIAAWSRVAESWRVGALARTAASLGLRFEAHGGRFLNRGHGGAPCVRALGGAVGRNLVSDDVFNLLELVAHDGRRVVMAVAPAKGIPSVRIEARRPGVAGRASSIEAAEDELMPAAPAAFFEAYRVFGDASVGDRWSPALVELLLAQPGWNVETWNATLFAWNDAQDHLAPATLAAQVAAHRAIVRAVMQTLGAPTVALS